MVEPGAVRVWRRSRSEAVGEVPCYTEWIRDSIVSKQQSGKQQSGNL